MKSLLLGVLVLVWISAQGGIPRAYAAGAVSITRSFNSAADAWVHEGMVHGNHGNCATNQGQLVVEAPGSDETHTFLRFDQNTIPAGSTVSSATLTLYYYGKAASKDPVGRTYYVDRITQTDWVEGTGCHGTQTGSSDWTDRQHSSLAWTTLGGTYTTTDEASATVPATFGWMTWTVTNQVQTAATSDIPAHFIVRDPNTAAGYYARFYARENGSNIPNLSVTFTAVWDSYNNSARTVQSDNFSGPTQDTAYMRGTGFNLGGNYVVGYYDGSGDKRCTESVAASGGILDSSCQFKGQAAPGTWDAYAFEPGVTSPSTKAGIDPDTHKVVGHDQFTVQSDAITPEIPSMIAAIMIGGLTIATFWWFAATASHK